MADSHGLWQKTTQYCKATNLQLKVNKLKKNKIKKRKNMEAFLAIHSHLELPTGCQGDRPRGGLSKAGWKDVYFIQRDCVTRRNEAEPQKPSILAWRIPWSIESQRVGHN